MDRAQHRQTDRQTTHTNTVIVQHRRTDRQTVRQTCVPLLFHFQKAFKAPVVPVPATLTPEKQLMIEQFSKQSGMNTDWSAR